VTRVSWRLDLAATGCRAEERSTETAGEHGSFRQQVSADGAAAAVVRETEIRSRWVEPAGGPELRELALAEHRAVKRRLRFDCSGAE